MPMYRVRTVFSGVAGTPWYSNLYFNASEQTALGALDAADNFWIAQSNYITQPITWVTEGDVPTVNEVTGDITGVTVLDQREHAGANNSVPLPYANQALINLNTSVFFGGRQVRGKIFVPGGPVGASTGGNVTSLIVTDMQTDVNALVDDPDSTLCVWSKKNGQIADVTAATVSNEWAVLRSRRD